MTRFPTFVHEAVAPDTVHRALRTRLTANKPGGRLEQSQSPGAYGHRPAAAQVKPRVRLFADAGPVICAVPPLSICASVAGVGVPAGAQLVPMIQLPVASTQVWTCACAGAETAATSAIVASNLDKTNSQPARARDVAPRRGSMDDSRRGSRPTSNPNQSASQ